MSNLSRNRGRGLNIGSRKKAVHLTKILILACASYYEQQLQEAYTNYAQRESDRYGNRPHGFDNDKRDKSVY